MPYIDQTRRSNLDPLIERLAEWLQQDSVGDLNYIITRLISLGMAPSSYAQINSVIGVLECAKLELYRRIAAPYEDVKARTNGDVYPPMKVYIESLD